MDSCDCSLAVSAIDGHCCRAHVGISILASACDIRHRPRRLTHALPLVLAADQAVVPEALSAHQSILALRRLSCRSACIQVAFIPLSHGSSPRIESTTRSYHRFSGVGSTGWIACICNWSAAACSGARPSGNGTGDPCPAGCQPKFSVYFWWPLTSGSAADPGEMARSSGRTLLADRCRCARLWANRCLWSPLSSAHLGGRTCGTAGLIVSLNELAGRVVVGSLLDLLQVLALGRQQTSEVFF